MKKLIFYSDQVIGKSDKLDEELLSLINKEAPKLAYIPPCSDLSRKYYNEKIIYYRRLGINDLLYFDIDKEFDESRIEELFQCDAIHLSGGDTAYFLSNIKKRKLEGLLKDYVNNGGVLIGISAGSIIMTETINIINVGEEESNIYDFSNMQGLGLVNFEFMPHWDRGTYNIEEFKVYTMNSERPLYLCTDRDGIVVSNNDTKFVGNILKIEKGIITKI
jgi:dipeptidase E